MGYPIGLDEFRDDEIKKEYERRERCRMKSICHYCGKDKDGGVSCKLYDHVPSAPVKNTGPFDTPGDRDDPFDWSNI